MLIVVVKINELLNVSIVYIYFKGLNYDYILFIYIIYFQLIKKDTYLS